MELNQETVCGLILQIRQFDGKEAAVDPEDSSNPSDTASDDVPYKDTLQEGANDSIEQVIRAELNAMNNEELREMAALVFIGRGDNTAEEFMTVKTDAARDLDGRIVDYLLEQPMLGDLLANGLAAMGQPCDF